MKIYFPKKYYDPDYRGQVFPLLKPYLKKKNFSDEERIKLYGVSKKSYEFVEEIGSADIVILPMSWNYYIRKGMENPLKEFLRSCMNDNTKVFIYNSGDYGVKIPHYRNAIIFRSGGYRKNFKRNEYIIPSFINDPLDYYYQRSHIFRRSYSKKPTVGFCGQAVNSFRKSIKDKTQIALHNFSYYLGLNKEEPQAFLSSSYLRNKILKSLGDSPLVATNFIKRRKYRAGVKKAKMCHSSSNEFFENIKNSDYTVCVRGKGNFSIRFYEVLAMGRIPVYIDTGGVLPLEDKINWKRHIVWIKEKNRNKVAEKILEFHSRLSPNQFLELQEANRQLWLKDLSLKGFFENFISPEKKINKTNKHNLRP